MPAIVSATSAAWAAMVNYSVWQDTRYDNVGQVRS